MENPDIYEIRRHGTTFPVSARAGIQNRHHTCTSYPVILRKCGSICVREMCLLVEYITGLIVRDQGANTQVYIGYSDVVGNYSFLLGMVDAFMTAYIFKHMKCLFVPYICTCMMRNP